MSFDAPPHDRSNNFDFLRLILAGLVLYSHSFVIARGGADDTITWLSRSQVAGGALAVGFFFFISGFLVTASWLGTKGTFGYLLRRVLRIYPAFIVVTIVCALIVGPLATNSVSAYFADLNLFKLAFHAATLTRVELAHVFVDNPYPHDINASLWTIKPEFELYLLVAAFGLADVYRYRFLPAVLFACVLLIWGVQSEHWAPMHSRLIEALGTHASWTWWLTYFLGGMSFYLYRDRIQYSSRWFTVALAIVAVSAATTGLAIVLPIFGSYAVMYIAYSGKLRMYDFGRKRDLSYGVYLYAWPIQQLFVYYIAGLNPYTLFLLAMPATCVCAAVSWYAIEKPFLALKRYHHARSGGDVRALSPPESIPLESLPDAAANSL